MGKCQIQSRDKSKLSSITLNDSASVWIDDGKKSVAYFCKKTPVRVDKHLILELKSMFRKIRDRNVRLCLHARPEAPFHEMIVLERKARYYRPHKHLTKGETFHIIEGKMAVFSFNDDGEVVDSCVLELKGNIMYKVRDNMYHAVMPLSDPVIYRESKPGPFTGQTDSIYPAWAPDGNNSDEIAKYKAHLRSKFED